VIAAFRDGIQYQRFTMQNTEPVGGTSWPLMAKKRIEETIHLLNGQEWIAQLLVRVFVGYFFMETGWAKLHNLDGFARRFAGWGIPWPHFNAALSAYTEFIGGLLTIFGIGTRLVSIPMIINMLVAILKVNLMSVNTLDDFVELGEPLYALTYLWLLISGPGWVSVDYVISRVLGLKSSAAEASPRPSKDSAVLKHSAVTVP
jgi:putative oxidoreductase